MDYSGCYFFMLNLKNFRLPYKDDTVFGWLFLMALAVPLAFDIYNFENYEIIKLGLFSMLLGGALIAFVFSLRNNILKLRLPGPFLLIVALFIFWSLIVTVFAWDKNYAFFGFYARFTSSFIFLFEIALLLLVLSALSLDKLGFLLKTLFFTAFLVALWGIMQSLGYGYYSGITSGLFSRADPSFLGNPNFSSMYVASLAPLGVWFYASAKGFWQKVYFFMSLFIQICSVVIFSSRGSMLGLACGLVFSVALGLYFSKIKINKTVLAQVGALAALFILTAVFFNFIRPGGLAGTLSLKDINIQDRLGVWQVSLKSFVEHPILGVGLGNFELAFEAHRELSGLNIGFFDDPHNLFLNFLVTGGFPLLILFLLLPGYAIVLGFKRLKKNGLEFQQVAVMGSIVAWLVTSFFTPVSIPCYLLLAFLISALFVEGRDFPVLAKRGIKIWIGVLGGAVLIFGLCFLTAENLFFFSTRSYNAQNFKRASNLAKSAITFFPFNNLYFQYLAAADIRQGRPPAEVEKDLAAFASFHKKRSFTYNELAALDYLKVYQNQDAALMPLVYMDLDKAVQLDPYSANNYFDLAQYYLVGGNPPKAEAAAVKALQLSPKAVRDGWMLLAKIYQVQNNRQSLISALEHALAIDPQSTDISMLLRHAKSIDDIRKLPLQITLSVGQLN